MGALYLSAFLGSTAFHVANVINYHDKTDELQKTLDDFYSTTDQTLKYNLGLLVKGKTEDADKAYDNTKTSLYLTMGVYIINVIDVIFFTPDQKEVNLTASNGFNISPYVSMDKLGNPLAGFRIGL